MERFKGSSAVVSNWRWTLRTHIIFATQFWVTTRQLRNILYTVRHSVFILQFSSLDDYYFITHVPLSSWKKCKLLLEIIKVSIYLSI